MHVNEKIGATEGCESSVLWCVKNWERKDGFLDLTDYVKMLLL